MLVREGLHLPSRMPMVGLPRHCLLPPLAAPGENISPTEMRERWLLRRRQSLGASDIPAILGESPWSSPCSTWAEKTGLKPIDTTELEHQRFGHLMEGVIHQEMESRYPHIWCIDPKGGTVRHPVLPFLTASVDRMLYLDSYRKTKHLLAPGWIPLEIKNVSEYKKNDWTPTKVPRMYYVQVQAQLLVTGRAVAVLAALIGGNRMLVYTVTRDDAVCSQILTEARAFWTLVETDTLPELDDSEATTEALGLLHSSARFRDRKTIDSPEILKAAHRYIRVSDAIKRMEEAKRGTGNILRNWMAEDHNARAEDGTSILWYEQKKGELNEELMLQKHPEIVKMREEVEKIESQYTTPKVSRVLKVSAKSAAPKKKTGKAKITPLEEVVEPLAMAA